MLNLEEILLGESRERISLDVQFLEDALEPKGNLRGRELEFIPAFQLMEFGVNGKTLT